jgi:hypothetical protein
MTEEDFTFDRWVQKVFAGRAPTWRWMDANAGDPRRADWLITYPTRLFLEPEFLVDSFSDKQLRRGFWRLPNDWELRDFIWHRDFPWTLRRACIRAMVPLFDRFFAQKPLGNTCHMWWDLFRYFGDDRDQRVVNEMYLALKKILLMDSIDCQGAALHGLGHIDHPKKTELINRYLRAHPDLDPDHRSYALACIEGKVL